MAARAPFIDLDRRFRELTGDEREDPEVLAMYAEHHHPWSDTWDKLLEHPRVVILAEAGSGKTREMRERASRMAEQGLPAFFIALEALQHDDPRDLLTREERALYDAWHADDAATGWFFLDALDELKLVHGTLERALRRLGRAIEGRLARVRVVLSSRPTDWRPITDLEAFEAHLPIVTAEQTPASADELFLQAIRRDDVAPSETADETADETPKATRVVALLPLGEKQIRRFVERAGVSDPARFLEEVRQRDAWTFARRPLDLTELVAFWRTHGRLGSRGEQHEANIKAKLKDDPSRADKAVLSEQRARLGAERMALALEMTRNRTISAPELAPEIDVATGAVDAADVLPDWSEQERQALLRRALFDPATYGRVRFHHRSVQEYLAAKRLIELRRRGMTAKALRRLLFAERYGESVVMPSARAVSAWVGLWDDDVRQELMRREPEVLLTLGDPEGLPTEARAQLLRAFAQAYGQGGDRGINVPIDEVRRLAHADLAPTITEIWRTPQLAPDVKELLLELIWQGAIDPCADISAEAARDGSLPPYERVISVRALATCNRPDLLAPLAAAMLDARNPWPPEVLHGVVHDLFPAYWTPGDLRRLIARTPEPRATVGGFSWALRQVVLDLDPASPPAVSLRNALAALIWRGRDRADDAYQANSRYSYLATALGNLCQRQLALPGAPSRALLRACVIAHRYGHDGYGDREDVAALKAEFKTSPSLREAAFWLEVDFVDKRGRAPSPSEQLFRAEHGGLVEPVTDLDWDWLLRSLGPSAAESRRALALEAIIPLWWRRGRPPADLAVLTGTVADDSALASTLATQTAPRRPHPAHLKMRRKSLLSKRRNRRKEQRRLSNWETWRQGVLADPASAFQAASLNETMANLYVWLRQASKGRSSYNVWDRAALERAYSPEVARLAAEAFRNHWRLHPVTPMTQRPAEERHTTPRSWALGLTGLAAEAESGEDWASRLSPGDAATAGGYALAELNGFPHWAADLAMAQPAVFDNVVGGELSAQLALVDAFDHLQVLQDLGYAADAIKRLLAPRVYRTVTGWPAAPSDTGRAHRAAHHLDTALDILIRIDDAAERANLVSLCEQRFVLDPQGPFALAWLRGLMRLSAVNGARVLESHIEALPPVERNARAIALMATLFGDPGGTAPRFETTTDRVATLHGLIRFAYRYVRREDDNEHDGAYSPDERDDAERGRGFLIGALFETPGPEAWALTGQLADDPLFSDWPDRLRLIARERAAKDSEGVAMTVGEIIILEGRLEAPPHDRDTLFRVMLDRLEDLAHDFAHDDFSDRRTLRTIKDESEMQRTLAWRLRAMSDGAYVVVREDEVADQKRTDIRLAAADHKAVIEVKLADRRWAFSDLEKALRKQLVGQYLRHRRGRAGCLLLVYDGTKQWWCEGKRRLKFEALVERLQEIARDIEREHGHDLLVTVLGLDLRDPLKTSGIVKT